MDATGKAGGHRIPLAFRPPLPLNICLIHPTTYRGGGILVLCVKPLGNHAFYKFCSDVQQRQVFFYRLHDHHFIFFHI